MIGTSFPRSRPLVHINSRKNRLYLQPRSDDPTHDEALSSRVAALNMLDLGLEHLDVDISSSNGEEVGRVVRACGESEFCSSILVIAIALKARYGGEVICVMSVITDLFIIIFV